MVEEWSGREAWEADHAETVARLVARVEEISAQRVRQRWAKPRARRGRDHAERAAEAAEAALAAPW